MNQKKSYQEQYGEALNLYKEMLQSYDEMVSSARYHEILGTMPFEFLNANQLCEKLLLYHKLEKKPKMKFGSVDEVIVFYRNLIQFDRKTEQLLEDAAFIANVGSVAKELNEYVCTSPYLGNNYCVQPNIEVINIAQKCLLELPQFPKLRTKEFRWNFIESAILSLEMEELNDLVTRHIIKPADIDNISLNENVLGYHEKIEYLCKLLNRDKPIAASYNLKLKGVTFANLDGSSRQENLESLMKYAEENAGEIPLRAESYTYVPEIGNPEPAIRIYWGEKEIGNIAKDVAEEITNKYKNPQFTATLEKISGGENGLNFGCLINLNIIAPAYVIAPETQETKEK